MRRLLPILGGAGSSAFFGLIPLSDIPGAVWPSSILSTASRSCPPGCFSMRSPRAASNDAYCCWTGTSIRGLSGTASSAVGSDAVSSACVSITSSVTSAGVSAGGSICGAGVSGWVSAGEGAACSGDVIAADSIAGDLSAGASVSSAGVLLSCGFTVQISSASAFSSVSTAVAVSSLIGHAGAFREDEGTTVLSRATRVFVRSLSAGPLIEFLSHRSAEATS